MTTSRSFYASTARVLGLHMALILLEIEIRFYLMGLILKDMGVSTKR